MDRPFMEATPEAGAKASEGIYRHLETITDQICPLPSILLGQFAVYKKKGVC